MSESLRDALVDIKRRLERNQYKNEEHIRLSLVTRILAALGWDVWNPEEVNAEFCTVPNEDKTKVDLALFNASQRPAVYIEVKAVNKLMDNLSATELQVRDYNRNNDAQFCILTDGRIWRIYYALTAGEFRDKCIKSFDLLSDDSYDIELNLDAYLSKEEIISGRAKNTAESEFEKTEKQRTLEAIVPQAVRKAEESGDSAKVIIINLAKEKGIEVTTKEAEELYLNWRNRENELILTPPILTPSISKRVYKQETVKRERRKKRSSGISQKSLIPEVVLALQQLGGRSHKSKVEDVIFKKFKRELSEEYYQKPLKNGQVTWRNMVEWARDRAKREGFIKPPEARIPGQRGIWELTEKGKSWQP